MSQTVVVSFAAVTSPDGAQIDVKVRLGCSAHYRRRRSRLCRCDYPAGPRRKLIQALAMLETKRDKNPLEKRGNIPL